MRIPKYLSPTSVGLFYQDKREFYLRYLADNRPPRFKQTQPMSIGSGFDAFVKCYISEKLFGEVRENFELASLFETQVEEHNREWSWPNSKYVFEAYKKSGALADLMIELEKALNEPRFEFTVEGRVSHQRDVNYSDYDLSIPLLGKPDVYFVTRDGAHVILDWKVNGYCGRGNTSPNKGYIKIRDAWDHLIIKPSRGSGGQHKDAQIMNVNGISINVMHNLEDVYTSWADQLAIYGWLLGEDIGAPFIVGIEQIVGNGTKRQLLEGLDVPLLRVATHRCRISSDYQNQLMDKVAGVWDAIQAGPEAVFKDECSTPEECLAMAEMLDEIYKAYEDDGHEHNDWFGSITRD